MMMPTVPDNGANVGVGRRDAGPHVLEGETLLAQITIEQRIIIRVPMARPSGNGPGPNVRPDRQFRAPQPAIEWNEEKGPQCVGIRMVRAASVTTSRGVDLMLRDGTRLRAHLSRECRSADLWSGFYIQPNADGNLCADRDEVLARGGQSCEIERFRKLVPEKP
ncbi:hypothetical protein [Sphingobium subterraneum]|uniref:Uncharacterized protein n=1 Tax=Sphingobium subterraneum TaxID=627688 RepID=A0A841IYZ0_9SPHN|nr:hypothetical protein [Sphingobium subterraneum]MBB6123540.1 hypothetical protein [Sphingobium subterraneum]